MRMLGPRFKHASMVWLEPRRVHAGGQSQPFSGEPSGEGLLRALASLPLGPTHWVVDDAWMPSLLLRDIVEVPSGAEPREAFFRWRYGQDLMLEAPQFVQALALEDNAWLLAGVPQALRDAWIQAAAAAGRPMRRLQPRWLWLYNRLAPTRELPGMLLSLSLQEEDVHRHAGRLGPQPAPAAPVARGGLRPGLVPGAGAAHHRLPPAGCPLAPGSPRVGRRPLARLRAAGAADPA